MKAVFTVLVLAGLAAGGYYVFSGPKGTSGANVGMRDDGSDTGSKTAKGAVTKVDEDAELVASTPKKSEGERLDREQERRREWRKLRPTSERFLPDPDNVGPCPPVYAGARAARVVRRFLDPANGARVWEHDDGSFTRLAFGVGSYKDARTGRMLPKELVITQVPTEAVNIAPDDLPTIDTSKSAKKDGQ